jgi:hypothetical protein
MIRILGNTACGLALVAALLPAALAAQDETPSAGTGTPAQSISRAEETSTGAAMTPPTLAAVVEQLSVESRKKFANLLEADWKQRPEWGDMLIMLLKGSRTTARESPFRNLRRRQPAIWLPATVASRSICRCRCLSTRSTIR